MLIILTILQTTMMILCSLLLMELCQKSICASEQWRAEVRYVGANLKDDSPYILRRNLCRGPQVNWSFEGKLNAKNS